MKSRRSSRSLVALVAAATVVMTACGASAPPGKELADEMIDTLEDANGVPLPDAVKDCMRKAVADFELTDEEHAGFDNLDDVAAKADEGQPAAMAIMVRFESELAACNPAG